MRYYKIDTHLFVENRQRLSERLSPHSVVILLSNDRMPTNADGTLPFKQNSNLFYFTNLTRKPFILILRINWVGLATHLLGWVGFPGLIRP